MLFDRFVFVLYILFSYSWFLLGSVYESPFRFVPIVGMAFSLLSICLVTLFQLQTLVRRKQLIESDRWSTMTWSAVHVMLCVMLCLDGLEWTNVLILFCIAGIFVTLVITTVAICSCYVILQNSDTDDWSPHVHLTCICFWVLVHYMVLRLPSEELQYTTTIPVVLMGMLRVSDHLEDCSWSAFAECCLFAIAIVLHVCRDSGVISPVVFFWGTTVSVCLMILFSKSQVALVLVILLPLLVVPLGVFVVIQCLRGVSTTQTLASLLQTYDEMTVEELVLPLDMIEVNWEERL